MQNFGSRLGELRKQHLFSQHDLAEKLNVHITTIKNWENNICSPDAKNICALADLFQITVDSLLGRVDTETITLPELSPEKKNKCFILFKHI